MTNTQTVSFPEIPNPIRPLEEEAESVLSQLRKDLNRVIEAQRGGEIRKAADLHKALGLNRSLSWNLYKAATTSKSIEAGIYVPGSAPMNSFLRAAERRGTPAELIENLRRSFDDFERLVEREAGDREAFESMITHPDRSRRDAEDIKHKRAAFRANSHLWGGQSRCIIHCSIIHPGTKAETVDTANIRGFIGVRQMRPSAPTFSGTRWKAGGDQSPGNTHNDGDEPIDPAGTSTGGVNLLERFGTQPPPRFNVRIDSDGYMRADLVSRGIGNSAAMSYFVGSIQRGNKSPFSMNAPNPAYLHRTRRPAEVMLLDLLMHRSLWNGSAPDTRVCTGDGGGFNTDADLEAELLPVQEQTVDLGTGLDVLHSPDVPRYQELIEHSLQCLGWPADEFRVFRTRIEYPIMHSLIRLTFRNNPTTE